MTIEQLINDLRRPMYIYTMAQRDSQFDTPFTRSCKTRRANAEKEIDEIVRKYVNGT